MQDHARDDRFPQVEQWHEERAQPARAEDPVLPLRFFKDVVLRSIRLAEAPSYGLPISAYAPSSVGAHAYDELAKELLKGDAN